MATLDGFIPYPVGLTAANTVAAILRASNLDTELLDYQKFTASTTAPLVGDTKTGDLWENTTNGRLYRAAVDTGVLIWFEA